MDQLSTDTSDTLPYIVDSCPIGKEIAFLSRESCRRILREKLQSFPSGMVLWGKIHAFVQYRAGHLPLPAALFLSNAAEHDLTAAKQITLNNCPFKRDRIVYADKAYVDADWRQDLQQENVTIVTPRRKAKGDPIASIRQSVESFVN